MSVRRDADGNELDPLARRDRSPDRVFYDEGVMLDADDFGTEQAYHRGRLARALQYLFGMGTVAGLGVSVQGIPASDAEEVRVAPGLAFDRFGRQIEVPRPACARIHRWWRSLIDLPDGTPNVAGRSRLREGWRPADGPRPSGVTVDVFLRFVECERGLTPAFATGPYDATDAVRPHRLRDGYELSLHVQPVRAVGDLPVPPDPFVVGTAVLNAPGAPARLHTAQVGDWHDGTDHFDVDGRPLPQDEHPPGADPTSVLLARLLIPANEAPDVASAPVRRIADPVLATDTVRRRVAAPGLFTRWPEGV